MNRFLNLYRVEALRIAEGSDARLAAAVAGRVTRYRRQHDSGHGVDSENYICIYIYCNRFVSYYIIHI